MFIDHKSNTMRNENMTRMYVKGKVIIIIIQWKK